MRYNKGLEILRRHVLEDLRAAFQDVHGAGNVKLIIRLKDLLRMDVKHNLLNVLYNEGRRF